jgi:two-component system response regulator YesN
MIKLLVVDDEVFVRVGLASAVAWKDHGFELVGGAEDGASALEQCRRLRPDIALVDIKMNGMDGLDFIERARQEFPGMRFIVLSCHNDFKYMQRAIRLGVRDYIVKNTVQPRELVEAVTKVAQGLHPGDKALGESKPDPLLSLFEGDSAVFDECALRIPFFAVAVEAVDREAFLRK